MVGTVFHSARNNPEAPEFGDHIFPKPLLRKCQEGGCEWLKKKFSNLFRFPSYTRTSMVLYTGNVLTFMNKTVACEQKMSQSYRILLVQYRKERCENWPPQPKT